MLTTNQSLNHSRKVMLAEVMTCKYIAMHNISFQEADHFSDLIKTMFPDSAIARDFPCKHSKQGPSYVKP